MTYKYLIDQCEVSDKSNLEVYRQKRSEWLYMLNGDPDHAIWRQITTMLWNDAVFRMVLDTRKFSSEAGYQSSAQNWALARFMDQGFVATQTLSIRKLMEKASTNRKTQVVSLRRVLDDINERRNLITRECYVAYDGLPYDPSPNRNAFVEDPRKSASPVVDIGYVITTRSGYVMTTGPTAWLTAQKAHESFDRLSGVTPNHRSRDDVIRNEVFEKIEAELTNSGWKDIAEFGNKYIAHAANEDSRGLLSEGQHSFPFDNLARCHKSICRAAASVYQSVLWQGSHEFFPIPQFNIFENLEAPWLPSDDVEKLARIWRDYIRKFDAWAEADPLD